MKTSILAVAASALLASGASARSVLRRNAHANAHAHMDIEERGTEYCPPKPCTTYVTGTWVEYNPPQPQTYQSTSSVAPISVETSTSVVQVTATLPPSYASPVPTPLVTTCPTPGVYTIPAKTITLTSTQTACVPTSTVVPPGTHTLGTSVTVVSTSTVVVCPYATILTSSATAYTTIATTTITCPSAGSYTYGGMTTAVTETATCEYPVVTEYAPNTYTQPLTTVTVTETSSVITCPFGPYVAPTTSSVYVAPTAPSSTPVYVAPTTPASTSVYVAPTPSPYKVSSSSVVAVASSPAKSSTGNNNNNIGGVGNQWCITYSPYNNDQSCKAASDIESDIADIASKGFSSIRLYSADCGALEVVGSSCKTHGLKIVLGIFVKNDAFASAENDLTDIVAWAQWDLVEMMVIGNEAVFNGYCSSADLAAFIASCKTKLVAAGCTKPITTSETVETLVQNPGLCNVIDVVGVNIHPYFNAGVLAKDAGTFLLGQMKIAEGVCGKTAYTLEAGWPSAGLPNGVAIPGVTEQKQALESIYAVDMGRITYFTYTNDGWKSPGALDVEQNFGCADLFPLESSSSY